jgi:uncharacterized RDD family membrane protein YckC
MNSAQRELLPLDETSAETEAAAPFALREQVAERLAAHRARRAGNSAGQVTPIAAPAPATKRSARIAAAVAERYAQSQSYRAFLADEAERAIRRAEAAAEVAAINAQAVADAQYQLLDELDQWALTPPTPPPTPALVVTPADPPASAVPAAASTSQLPNPGLTVRLYEYEAAAPRITEHIATSQILTTPTEFDEAEGLALDEEIAFRQAPTFDPSGSPTDIPANLIEFPRQLVAARKARPRLAEGPLREEADHAPDAAQLRIFEVEASGISTTPAVESVEPEWSSILLSAQPATQPVPAPETDFNPDLRPQSAPLELRLMSTIVDGCLILTAFLAFTAASAFTVGKLSADSTIGHITAQTAVITSAAVLAFLTILYQLLFFTLGEATPGMRYARIALCTFNDDNPTRSALRRRLFATLLAACPLGLGFLWALLDEDGLGWHDRISRMYQRSY